MDSEVYSFHYLKNPNHSLHVSNIIIISILNVSSCLCITNAKWCTSWLFAEGSPQPPLLSMWFSSLCVLHLHLHGTNPTMWLLLLRMSILTYAINEPYSLVLHSMLTLSFVVIIIIHCAYDTDVITCHILHSMRFLLCTHVLLFLARFSLSSLHLLSTTWWHIIIVVQLFHALLLHSSLHNGKTEKVSCEFNYTYANLIKY